MYVYGDFHEVHQLTTNSAGTTRTYGPFGLEIGSHPFSVRENVVAFYGRALPFVDAIGFYSIAG